ncbi:MAG: hypothetical protein WCK61_00115 [Candidatus Omnitrophota bacterium]
MNIARSLVITVFILFIAMGTFVVFAQETAILSPNDLAPASTLESPEDTEGNTQWVWGEVTNLDIKANTITLKYLDYENDQEKEFALVVDGNTAYENLKSFDEIKIKDTLSIDYKVTSDGKNLAKNISLEKSDILPADAQDSAVGNMPLSVPLQTAAPIMEQPIVESVTAAPEVAPVAAQQAQ